MLLPDKAVADLDPSWFLEEENIRIQDEIVVDLILKSCGETFDTLIPFQQTIYLDEIPIRTLSLDGLLKTKQTVREKDTLDRRVIEDTLAQLQRPVIPPKKKKWC